MSEESIASAEKIILIMLGFFGVLVEKNEEEMLFQNIEEFLRENGYLQGDLTSEQKSLMNFDYPIESILRKILENFEDKVFDHIVGQVKSLIVMKCHYMSVEISLHARDFLEKIFEEYNQKERKVIVAMMSRAPSIMPSINFLIKNPGIDKFFGVHSGEMMFSRNQQTDTEQLNSAITLCGREPRIEKIIFINSSPTTIKTVLLDTNFPLEKIKTILIGPGPNVSKNVDCIALSLAQLYKKSTVQLLINK